MAPGKRLRDETCSQRLAYLPGEGPSPPRDAAVLLMCCKRCSRRRDGASLPLSPTGQTPPAVERATRSLRSLKTNRRPALHLTAGSQSIHCPLQDTHTHTTTGPTSPRFSGHACSAEPDQKQQDGNIICPIHPAAGRLTTHPRLPPLSQSTRPLPCTLQVTTQHSPSGSGGVPHIRVCWALSSASSRPLRALRVGAGVSLTMRAGLR